MADRIVIMREGKVQQIGTPEEVFERPANLFVAGFIGSPPMNLIPAAALGRAMDGLGHHDTVVGVRPEHILFQEPAPHLPSARVTDVEMIGTESLVHGEIGGAGGTSRVTARVPRARAPRIGQTVGLAWPGQEPRLFDAKSGLCVTRDRDLAA